MVGWRSMGHHSCVRPRVHRSTLSVFHNGSINNGWLSRTIQLREYTRGIVVDSNIETDISYVRDSVWVYHNLLCTNEHNHSNIFHQCKVVSLFLLFFLFFISSFVTIRNTNSQDQLNERLNDEKFQKDSNERVKYSFFVQYDTFNFRIIRCMHQLFKHLLILYLV